ncbi:MAG: DUF4355 domain-containing protein [bacterium]|nr:DUF4355 domain-containing protein [bacterium]
MEGNEGAAQVTEPQVTGGNTAEGAAVSTEGENGASAQQGFTQKDIDSAVTKAVAEAQKQWKQEADEAAELAKLSKEAREKKVFEKEKKKLEVEKAKIERDKLLLETEKQLSGRKLPADFAEMLAGQDADSTLKNIECFEAAFSKAVEAAVDERLKAEPPKIFGGGRTQTDPFLSGFDNMK